MKKNQEERQSRFALPLLFSAATFGILFVSVLVAGITVYILAYFRLMPGGAGRYALVIGSEQMSRVLDMTDRTTCVLFGDGAGAAVFALDEAAEYASTRHSARLIPRWSPAYKTGCCSVPPSAPAA